MSERICPHCGKAIIDREARWCAYCWRGLDLEAPPEAPALDQPAPAEPPPAEPVTPPAEAVTPPPEPFALASSDPTGPQPGSPTPAPGPTGRPASPIGGAIGPSWPPDGQRRCTDCGEALYGVEHVCWSCGRRIDLSAPEPAADAVAAGVAPPAGAPALPPPPPPAGPVVATDRPVARHPVQLPAQRPVEPGVSGAAWWSFGLGLAAIFTCGLLSILGPVAIWLGVSANRRGGGPVAVAGIVLGIAGTLLLLAWLIGLALALAAYAGGRGPNVVLLPLLLGGTPCV